MELSEERKARIKELAKIAREQQALADERAKQEENRTSLAGTAAHTLEGKLTGVEKTVNELSLGAFPALVDNLGAAGRMTGHYLRGNLKDRPDLSYSDFLGQVQGERNERQERHPGQSLMGTFVGGGGAGMAGAGLVNKAAQKGKAAAVAAPAYAAGLLRAPSNIVEGTSALAKAGRVGASAIGGAFQGAMSAAGEGEDARQAGEYGFIGGGAGQFGGELLGMMGRSGIGQKFVSNFGPPFREFLEREAKVNTKNAIFNPKEHRGGVPSPAMNMNMPEGVDQATLMDKISKARPDNLMADLIAPDSDKATRALFPITKSPFNVGRTKQLEDVARERIENSTQKANEILLKYFKPAGSKAQNYADLKAEREAGKIIYEDMYNSGQAGKRIYGKRQVVKDFEGLITRESTRKERAAVRMAIREANAIDPDAKMFNGRTLISLKKALDDLITDKNPKTAVGQVTRMKLIEAKNIVSNRLKEKIGGYEEATKVYADQINQKDAFEAGMKMLKSNTFDSSEIAAYVDTLTEAEKAFFREGASVELQQRVATNGLSKVKKLMKDPNDPLSDKVRSIFDSVDFDKFIDETNTMFDELAVAETSMAAINAGASVDPSAASGNTLTNIVDALIATYQGITKGPASTQAVHPARRILRSPDQMQIETIMDFLQARGPDEMTEKIRSLVDAEISKRGPRTMLSGSTGQAIASIMDEMDQ